MEIIKITPRGFCCGVVNAWKLIKETIRDNPDKRIYMLGWFVHNQNMLNEIMSDNLIILDDSQTTRYELVDKLNYHENDIIILSAHGTEEQTILLAKKKGFQVVDTTCEYVYKTHNVIKKSILENKHIIYLGKQNHPESLATISIDKKIIFITDINQLYQLKEYYNKPVVVTNQTTLSIYDLNEYYEFIKNNFVNYELKNDICDATQQRQEALLNLNKKLSVLIVVGDQRSNNSKQLLKLGKIKKIPNCYLINSLDEVKQIRFNKTDVVGITSGASTPTKTTNEIINYLESII